MTKPAIYAYPVAGGPNTALDIPGWNEFALSRSREFVRERQRHAEGGTPRWIGPFTLADGRRVKVRPAPCGAGCFCAAEFKEVRRD